MGIKYEKPEPVTTTWSQKDDEERATIGLLVEDNQLQHIWNAESARDAWDGLKGYHQKAILTRYFCSSHVARQSSGIIRNSCDRSGK